MAISIGAYLINLSVYEAIIILIINKIFNPIFLWQFGSIAGILLNVGAAANAVILYNTRFKSHKINKIFYFYSSEYRKTFKNHLSMMAKACGIKGTNTVTAVVTPLFPTSTQKNSKNNY